MFVTFLVLISQRKHVVGTQKNGLNETVLLSTQKHVYIDRLENNYNQNCFLIYVSTIC